MGKMVRLLSVLGALFVSACATSIASRPPTPAHIVAYHTLQSERADSEDSITARRQALDAEEIVRAQIHLGLKKCEEFLDTREERAGTRRKLPAALLIGGIIASSIVVPTLAAGNAAANAGWIAGVGGLSGGAIASAKVLESSGLSGAADAREHNDLAKIVRELVADALDPTRGFDERLRAAVRIEAECSAQPIHVPTMPNG